MKYGFTIRELDTIDKLMMSYKEFNDLKNLLVRYY